MKRKRAQITEEAKNSILNMYKSGMIVASISSALHINRSTIYKFIKRYKASGSIENAPRSGRPPLWTKRDDTRLSKLLTVNKNASIPTLQRLFNENGVHTVCKATISVKVRDIENKRQKRKAKGYAIKADSVESSSKSSTTNHHRKATIIIDT